MRLARCADIAAVQQQPVMCPWNIFRGYVFYQCLFYLIRGIGTFGDEAETVADTEDMRVNGHR